MSGLAPQPPALAKGAGRGLGRGMSATLPLVTFLKASGVPVDEADLKVHLACWNGSDYNL